MLLQHLIAVMTTFVFIAMQIQHAVHLCNLSNYSTTVLPACQSACQKEVNPKQALSQCFPIIETRHCKKEVHLVKLQPEIIIDALEQLHKLALENIMHPKACCLKEGMQHCCCCAVCWQTIQ